MGGGLRRGSPRWALKDRLVKEEADISGESSWDPESPAGGKGLKEGRTGGGVLEKGCQSPFTIEFTTCYLL